MEDLVQVIEKLMIEQWSLPEEHVRQFLRETFSSADGSLSLEDLRDQTSSLLQDVVASTLVANPAAE